MGKVDVYFADYLVIDDITEQSSRLLASNGCIIGMPLKLTWQADSGLFTVSTVGGDVIGTANPKNKLAIREALENGNDGACWLSLVWYDNTDKLYHAELVYQFYNVKASQTTERANLDAYTRKTSERLAEGKRPDIALTGAGWDQVLATGDWESPDEHPYPIDTKRNSGCVIFKHKRSGTDKLVMGLIAGKPTAVWGAGAACLILIIVILFFVCRCAFGA